MKIVFLFVAILVFNQELFSQWAVNENPLTLKELRLNRLQEKKIRKINKDAIAKINLLKKSYSGYEEVATKIDEINGARIKKIRKILTPEQQIIWRKKLMENKPHRGVTGLPNERTVQ